MASEAPTAPGAILEPTPAGLPSIEPLLGAPELPEQFIVPYWRDCYDGDFQPIPLTINDRILNQDGIDSCVGHGTSVQKSAQERVLVSPRDIFRLAKRLDGYGLDSYGTTLLAAQDAQIETGIGEDTLIDRRPSMGRKAYLSLGDVTDEVTASRNKHKSKSTYYVPRTKFKETLIGYGFPLVTSSAWYPEDSAIGPDGLMAMPHSNVHDGHCFACIGWVNRDVKGAKKSCYVMVNSFSWDWGANGLFYVPIDGTENRLGNGYISIDIQQDLAALLAQYSNKNVKVIGGAEHWRIEGGQRRQYKDEIVFWSFGGLFGVDVFDIDQEDLDSIPLGPYMNIEDAPFKTRELVRQVRQNAGLK